MLINLRFSNRPLRFSLQALVLGALLASSGCSTVPITGRNSLSLVSDEEVLKASREQYSSFVSQSMQSGMIVQDERVTRISNNLIAATKSYLLSNNYASLWGQMQWEVNTVKSNEINAFCMPGGKIIVYTGMTRLVGLGKGSDDELAAVIGHEIAHAIARHANERLSRSELQRLGGGVLQSVVGDGSPMKQLAISTLYDLGTQAFVALPFNRKQELEADKIGLVLMAIAGYNPEYAISLWQKMARASSGSKNSFFSTHPSEEKRIEEIRAYLPKVAQYYKLASTPASTTPKSRTKVGTSRSSR